MKMNKTGPITNRFHKALTAPATDRPVLDVVVSTTEAVVDILTKDELIAAVPVFGTAFKAVKALDSMRDRLFAAKLQQFLAEADTMTPEARAEAARKLAADDDGRKAAETLLLVLDKLTDMDKPALLGLLLKHLGNGRINTGELRRLACAIDLAFPDDLAVFLSEPSDALDRNSNASHWEALVSAGLTRVLTGDTIALFGEIYFGTTDLGKLLHALVNG